MRTAFQHAARLAAAAAFLGLAGCVGAPTAYAPAGERRPEAAAYGYGNTCSAGAYTCALPAQGALGAPCSCPGLGAPSYGTVVR